MKRSATAAFTLIEMLTVLVIIGLMLGIGIPAVTNLMKSSGLNSATRQVSNALNWARQYAITHRTKTRVVFPCNVTGITYTNLAPWHQSYAVVEIGTTINYLSKWERLPVGTVFMDANNNASVGSPPSVDILGPPASLPFPSTNSGSSATLPYIEFTPTGAASQAGAFTITEGLMNGGTVMPISKTSTSLVNAAVITVDSIIGRIKVTRP